MTFSTGKENGREIIEMQFENLDEYNRTQCEIRKLLKDEKEGSSYRGLKQLSNAFTERIGFKDPEEKDVKPVVRFINDNAYTPMFLNSIIDLILACQSKDEELEKEKARGDICKSSGVIKELAEMEL